VKKVQGTVLDVERPRQRVDLFDQGTCRSLNGQRLATVNLTAFRELRWAHDGLGYDCGRERSLTSSTVTDKSVIDQVVTTL